MAGELEENNVVQNAKEEPAERLKSDKEVAGKKEDFESGMTSKASGGLELIGGAVTRESTNRETVFNQHGTSHS
jgi:hypothetical protein